MFYLVRYSNGFTEVLPSKRVKKLATHAVAKHCLVDILHENEDKTACASFMEKLEPNTEVQSENLEHSDVTNKSKINVIDNQIISEPTEVQSENLEHSDVTNKSKINVNDNQIISEPTEVQSENLEHSDVTNKSKINVIDNQIISEPTEVQSENLEHSDVTNKSKINVIDNQIISEPTEVQSENLEHSDVTNKSKINVIDNQIISEPTEVQSENLEHSDVTNKSKINVINNQLISEPTEVQSEDLEHSDVTNKSKINVIDNHIISEPFMFVNYNGELQQLPTEFQNENLECGQSDITNELKINLIDNQTITEPFMFVNYNGELQQLPTAINSEITSIDDVVLDLGFEMRKAIDALEISSVMKNGKKVKAPQKKHCCFYCRKHVFKIYRHYTEVHKQEKEIKEITILPKKSVHRKSLLDNLRKKGDHLFNTQMRDANQALIVCRESAESKRIKRERNVPCPKCLGFYSKFSIRHHIEKCVPSNENKLKRSNIQAQCRKFENNIHSKASKELRETVFPVLNEDAVTNAIRYDELVITYANFLCRKYTAEHHAQQIRSNMRAIGRLILAIKEINPQINNLSDAFDPSYIDLIVNGIDMVACLDPHSKLYKSPATAMLLATELKKICKLMEMEFIKKGDVVGKKKMEDLSLLFNLEFQVTVNKKGLETQKVNHRRRKINLPKTDQIARFRIYLETKILHYTKRLEEKYSLKDWTYLAEYTLTHLAIFNRKRPGETQRLLIKDYESYEVVDDEDLTEDLKDNLSKEQIKKWARIRFTGKLGKNTALLIHRELGFKAIDLILKYRIEAGVNPLNRFIFGEPSQYHTQNTFQACSLIRKFSSESGIENPELLRTRLLRQHLATETARSSVNPRLEGRVSDFMSHKRHIHEDYYVLTQKTDDITKVSTLLEEFSSVEKPAQKSKLIHDNLSKIKPLTIPITPLPGTSKSSSSGSSKSYSPTKEYSSSDESDENMSGEISPEELSYIMGKKQKRHPWTTAEKEKAREYFHDEIHNGIKVQRQKAKKFFVSNRELYKRRTPHLIMQWVKIEAKKLVASKEGKKGQRLRWSTPEKEILERSVERHSLDGSIPSLSECELIIEENKSFLKNRTPQTVKSFIYNTMKKTTNCK